MRTGKIATGSQKRESWLTFLQMKCGSNVEKSKIRQGFGAGESCPLKGVDSNSVRAQRDRQKVFNLKASKHHCEMVVLTKTLQLF